MRRVILVLLGILANAFCITAGSGVKSGTNPSGESGQSSILERSGVYPVGALRDLQPLSSTESASSIALDPLNVDQYDFSNLTDASKDDLERAYAISERVLNEQRFVDVLTQGSIIDLPLGIVKKGGATDYIILIDSLIITPTKAFLTCFMVLELPQNGKKLAFKGTVGFTEGGLTGDAKMDLIADVPIKFGDKTLVTIKGGAGRSFVEWDCGGFKNLGITAQVEFSKDLIVPENPDGTIRDERVKAEFSTIVNDWNNLIVSISLAPFQVRGLNGFGFYVTQASFDFSDLNNPVGFQLPQDYDPSFGQLHTQNLWQGIFINEVSIKLPPQFKSKRQSGRMELIGSKIILDHMGFTGNVIATTPMFSLEDGEMKKWAYSLDNLGVYIQANQIKKAGFRGQLKVPVFDSALNYAATIGMDDNYVFSVATQENLKMSALVATIDLYPSSSLTIQLKDKEFLPSANLHGKLSVTPKVGGEDSKDQASFADISFENLQVRTVTPYIKIGAVSFGSEALQQKMANFPVSITDIGVKSRGDEIGLSFTLMVNLVGEESGGFKGDATLTVFGEMDKNQDRHKFKYKSVELNEINVDIDGGAYKLKGHLAFYKRDPIFGTGFQGNVLAEFTPGIKVEANAQFGNVRDLRYWYADAMVTMPTGVPIFTGVAIYGFGGGAYHHMKSNGYSLTSSGTLGRTSSGIVYVPDEKTFLGLKASVNIGIHPSPTPFNGDATFEISFNRKGGVNRIAFRGNGYFATPPVNFDASKIQAAAKKIATAANDKVDINGSPEVASFSDQLEKNTPKGQLSASVFIEYDFPNSTLHGNLEVFVSVAGGLLKGIGPNNSAGRAVLHFSPDEWYIHVGTPERRIGVQALGLAQLDSYLMIGTNIPGSPPPPQIVSDILGGMDLDYMRDLNSLGTGSGFAFGASLAFDTGDLTFMMFYARLAAGMGFDIMLKNYGDAMCKGRSGPIGINGWYANGQSYAYLQGKIGIKVDLPFYSGNYDIINLGAAAVLQAQLPNPVWIRGIVGGKYNILGGLVKGDCKFQLEIGQKCEIEHGGNPLSGIKVIAQVTPASGQQDVDVFNAPQAVFNMAVDKEFEFVDLENNKKAIRVKLDHFKVIDGSVEIPGTLSWNSEGDVAAFNPTDILPSKRDLKVKVSVTFEEYTNGIWKTVVDKKTNKKIVEALESSFKSGVAPDHIPASNIAYSYPINRQLNFYKDETTKGYIKLKQGQPELFLASPNWVQKGRFVSKTGESKFVAVSYANQQVNFTLPSDLKTNSIYAFEVVNLPVKATAAIDSNVDSTVTKVVGNESIELEVRTKKAEGTIDLLQEKPIYTSYFRTSSFGKFNDKINSFQKFPGWSVSIFPGIQELGLDIKGVEVFDKFEVNEINNNQPLIEFEADPESPWLKSLIVPFIYAGYPVNGMTVTWRNTDLYGIPPLKAMYIRQREGLKELTETDITSSSVVNKGESFSTIIFDLAYYTYKDFYEIREKAAAGYPRFSNSYTTKLLTNPFPTISSGQYRIKVKYRLPGTGEITSESSMIMNNL